MGSREGNDARDADGNEYELKTVNKLLTSSFSTHHDLNPTILAKYRAVRAWYFSIYEGIELVEIYRMESRQLEADYFAKWEKKWRTSGGKDINNPEIPIKYVRTIGTLVFVQERLGVPTYENPRAAPPPARRRPTKE